LLEARVGGGGTIKKANIDEVRDVDHVGRYVVCPLENLWTDVNKECVGQPSSE